jgi:hypothetical protein
MNFQGRGEAFAAAGLWGRRLRTTAVRQGNYRPLEPPPFPPPLPPPPALPPDRRLRYCRRPDHRRRSHRPDHRQHCRLPDRRRHCRRSVRRRNRHWHPGRHCLSHRPGHYWPPCRRSGSRHDRSLHSKIRPPRCFHPVRARSRCGLHRSGQPPIRFAMTHGRVLRDPARRLGPLRPRACSAPTGPAPTMRQPRPKRRCRRGARQQRSMRNIDGVNASSC